MQDTVYRAITLTLFTLIFTFLCFVQGIPRFTREPPSVLYVSSGGTARLVWDYNAKNKSALFDPYSPEWALYNSSGGRERIGVEDGFNEWTFVILKSCPARLRGRVSKESIATLAISNVTTADSGIYGCSLILLSGSPITSKLQLIVTDRPRFTSPVNSTTPIIEGSSLSIQCSATANPMPNVTWVRITERPKFISAGVGEAFLRFNNITRQQGGTYECQAINNPNEGRVTMELEVLVKFPVEPENISVSDIKVTSVVIKWLRPWDAGGSPVIEYKVLINTIPTREKITKTTYYVINGLIENTTYSVKVYARNAFGYGRPVYTEFTTKGRKRQVVKETAVNNESDVIVRVPETRIFAGVIGVVIWIVLMSTAVLLVFIKKRFTEKGTEQRKARNHSNEHSPEGIHKSTPPDTYKLDMQSYAEVDVSNQELQVLPVYAQVDKSKKRRPGEIVYAEIEEIKTKEGASTLAPHDFPPRYQETKYTDIKNCSSTYDTEEVYDAIYCNAE